MLTSNEQKKTKKMSDKTESTIYSIVEDMDESEFRRVLPGVYEILTCAFVSPRVKEELFVSKVVPQKTLWQKIETFFPKYMSWLDELGVSLDIMTNCTVLDLIGVNRLENQASGFPCHCYTGPIPLINNKGTTCNLATLVDKMQVMPYKLHVDTDQLPETAKECFDLGSSKKLSDLAFVTLDIIVGRHRYHPEAFLRAEQFISGLLRGCNHLPRENIYVILRPDCRKCRENGQITDLDVIKQQIRQLITISNNQSWKFGCECGSTELCNALCEALESTNFVIDMEIQSVIVLSDLMKLIRHRDKGTSVIKFRLDCGQGLNGSARTMYIKLCTTMKCPYLAEMTNLVYPEHPGECWSKDIKGDREYCRWLLKNISDVAPTGQKIICEVILST